MREMDMNTLCRLCLGERSKLLDVFASYGIQGLTAADTIMELLQIQVSANDAYPHCVCIECLKILEDFKLFKQRCESNKDLLDRAYARKLQVEPTEELIGMAVPCDVVIKEECIENPANEQENAVSTEYEEYIYDSYETSSDKLIGSTNPVTMPIKCEYADHTSVETDQVNVSHSSSVKKSSKKIHDLVDYPCGNSYVDVNIKEEVIDLHDEEYAEECPPMVTDDDPLGVPVTNTITGVLQMKRQLYYSTLDTLDASSSVPKVDSEGHIGVLRLPRIEKVVGNAEQLDELESVPSNTYICEICGEVLDQIQDMEVHMSDHGIDKQFNCESCDRVFYLSDSLIRHECNVRVKLDSPSIRKSIMCHWCGKEFSGVSKLGENEMIQCNECYEAISRGRGIEPRRTDDFACPVCRKSFPRKRSLNAHMIIHSSKRPYKCKECDKTFYLKGALTTHMRVHSGERPFKCDVCSESFSQRSHLESHTNTHYGERPFQCTECGSLFSRKSDVKRHMIIHSGNRQFKCDLCSRSFFYKGNLKAHIMTHSGQ